jgi:cystathionine beta-lyase/cystathionine gamma-synthase
MADSGSPVPPLGQSSPLVPPLYQSSVYTLPDLDALDNILDEGAPGFIYARDAHPNARALAEQLRVCEKAAWSVVCGSGMGAITASLLAVVQQGDRIVASNNLYGRTTQLLSKELERYSIRTAFVDARDQSQVRSALEKPARVLFVETMSNPLLAVADLEGLAEIAHAHDAVFMVDNTFATPVLCRPLELGADFVVESLTKMIGGHSDVTLGLACGMGDHLLSVSSVVSIWGFASNPFDCWLAARGLASLPLRMQAASHNAAALPIGWSGSAAWRAWFTRAGPIIPIMPWPGACLRMAVATWWHLNWRAGVMP